MLARKLEPHEIYLSRRNMAVAFEGEFDLPAELEKSKTEQADPAADHYGAFAEGREDPVASLVMNKLKARFDGHTVQLGGVGGVATLPPYRRGGAIRACMEASHRAIYREGFTFSALYPFSTAYYSQFGYAPGAAALRWQVPLDTLGRLPEAGGTVRQLFPGDDLSPLTEIYRQVYGEINLGCLREEYAPWMREGNFLSQRRSVFVWEDENGVPGAFLMGGRDRDVLTAWPDFPRKSDGLLFRDPRALTGLLRFLYVSLRANFRAVEFTVPGHIDLTALLPELAGMDCRAVLNGMLRVINAERALKLCRCKGEGRLAVQISDGLIAENNGTFLLAFAPGEENRVERTDARPDIAMGPGALAQLLAGCKGAEDLPWMPEAEVLRADAPFGQAFYRKPCHILDLF